MNRPRVTGTIATRGQGKQVRTIKGSADNETPLNPIGRGT